MESARTSASASASASEEPNSLCSTAPSLPGRPRVAPSQLVLPGGGASLPGGGATLRVQPSSLAGSWSLSLWSFLLKSASLSALLTGGVACPRHC